MHITEFSKCPGQVYTDRTFSFHTSSPTILIPILPHWEHVYVQDGGWWVSSEKTISRQGHVPFTPRIQQQWTQNGNFLRGYYSWGFKGKWQPNTHPYSPNSVHCPQCCGGGRGIETILLQRHKWGLHEDQKRALYFPTLRPTAYYCSIPSSKVDSHTFKCICHLQHLRDGPLNNVSE